MPHLGTRVLAGETGLDRSIAWAHVFDQAEPWLWLEPDELVMTSGPILVAGARAQSEYVTRLADGGAAALAISEHHLGPQVTGDMLATADRLGFPVLETAWEVSWSTLSRTVAEAGRDEAVLALSATERIYSALRAATLAGLSGGRLIADVAASQNCTAAILHADTGRLLLRDPRRPVPQPLLDHAQKVLRRRTGELRAGSGRFRVREHRGIVMALTRGTHVAFLVGHAHHRDPGPVVLRHLATVAASEYEQTIVGRGREQQRGADVLKRVLSERLPADFAEAELAGRGLDGALQIVALDAPAEDPELAATYSGLVEEDVAVLTEMDADCAYVLLRAGAEPVDTLLSLLPDGTHVGLSEQATSASELYQAARQARWALNLARATGTTVVRHADERLAAFLPKTIEDARSVVDRILGPLIAHDEAKGTDLVCSLRTFLEENRSWQKAAACLYVHKQTLVYRMRKIEALTGLRLDNTEDVAQLWLALRTGDMLG